MISFQECALSENLIIENQRQLLKLLVGFKTIHVSAFVDILELNGRVILFVICHNGITILFVTSPKSQMNCIVLPALSSESFQPLALAFLHLWFSCHCHSNHLLIWSICVNANSNKFHPTKCAQNEWLTKKQNLIIFKFFRLWNKTFDISMFFSLLRY